MSRADVIARHGPLHTTALAGPVSHWIDPRRAAEVKCDLLARALRITPKPELLWARGNMGHPTRLRSRYG